MKIRSKLLPVILLVSVSLGMLVGAQTATAAPIQQAQFVAPRLVVNSSFLNVRSGPGIQYSVLITVVGGTELPVLAQASDKVWFQVSTVVGVGWVNVQYTVPRGSFENVPVILLSDIQSSVSVPTTLGLSGQGGGGAPSSSTAPATGGSIRVDLGDGITIVVVPGERYRAVINVEAVNLRTQPADSATSLGTLYRDDRLDYPILGNAADNLGVGWIAIESAQLGIGWIEAPKVIFRLSRASGTVMVVTGNAVAMTDSPGGGGGNLPILSQGQEAFLVGIGGGGNFVQVQLGDGTTGWVPFSSVQTRTQTPSDLVDFNQLPAVSNPGANSDLGQGGGGVPNQVPAAFSLDTPHVVINTSFLNIRSGPGAQYTIVTTVSGGTELAVLGVATDHVWFLVQGTFGRGWVNSEFAVFRGSISAVPIIHDAGVIGTLANPIATISSSITLYAAPGTNFGAIGTLNGPIEVAVVARTADSTWLQLNTSLGYGWVLASQVIVRGDASLIPVVG